MTRGTVTTTAVPASVPAPEREALSPVTASARGTRRRSSRVVTVGSVAILVGALGACSSDPDDVGVCVNRDTNQRVDDDDCTNGRSGHGWYYIPRGRTFPAVGSAVSGGSFTTPSGSYARGGVTDSGGDITRGGFDSGKSSFGG